MVNQFGRPMAKKPPCGTPDLIFCHRFLIVFLNTVLSVGKIRAYPTY